MQVYINRAKALLLVGTISAGCASNNDDEGPGNAGSAGAAGAGTGGSTPSAGGSGQGGGGAGAGGAGGGGAGAGGSGQGGGGTGGTPSAGGSGPSDPDAGNPDPGDPDAGSPDAGDPNGTDAGGDAGACDDTADSLVSCTGVEPTDCDGLEGFLSSECEMLEFNLKPALANLARNCMIALEPPELCVTTNTDACVLLALESSCPDPEADDECTTIATACGDSSPASDTCSAALSGMTQSGRDQMVQCMTAPCDLFACIQVLDF
jgi:hypothetical protein